MSAPKQYIAFNMGVYLPVYTTPTPRQQILSFYLNLSAYFVYNL